MFFGYVLEAGQLRLLALFRMIYEDFTIEVSYLPLNNLKLAPIPLNLSNLSCERAMLKVLLHYLQMYEVSSTYFE